MEGPVTPIKGTSPLVELTAETPATPAIVPPKVITASATLTVSDGMGTLRSTAAAAASAGGTPTAPSLETAWAACRVALGDRVITDGTPLQQELARLEQVFGRYKDARGQLSAPAFETLLALETTLPADHAAQFGHAMAVLNTGNLSWDELRVGYAALHARHDGVWGDLRCHLIFRYYDTDRNGRWRLNEFSDVVKDIMLAQAQEQQKSWNVVLDPAVVLERVRVEAAKFTACVDPKSLTFEDFFYRITHEPRFRGTSTLWRLPPRPNQPGRTVTLAEPGAMQADSSSASLGLTPSVGIATPITPKNKFNDRMVVYVPTPEGPRKLKSPVVRLAGPRQWKGGGGSATKAAPQLMRRLRGRPRASVAVRFRKSSLSMSSSF